MSSNYYVIPKFAAVHQRRSHFERLIFLPFTHTFILRYQAIETILQMRAQEDDAFPLKR